MSETGLHLLLFAPAAAAGALALRAEMTAYAARRSAPRDGGTPPDAATDAEPDAAEDGRRHHNLYLVVFCVLGVAAVVVDHLIHGGGL